MKEEGDESKQEKSRLSAAPSDGGLTPKTQNVRTEKHV